MLGGDVHTQLLHDPGQARSLAGRQLQDQSRQRRGVHDRVFQGRPEAATDEVGVEGVMAVLDQYRTSRKAE